MLFSIINGEVEVKNKFTKHDDNKNINLEK